MTDENKTQEAIDALAQKELGQVKVLMVEDDSFMVEMVLNKLSSTGCVPYSTGRGDEAIDLALQYMPDVIILDLMLPGKSGEEILAELKAHDELKHIPVLVFSNKSNNDDMQKNLMLGAEEFLIKSATDLNLLADKVKQAAAKHKAV